MTNAILDKKDRASPVPVHIKWQLWQIGKLERCFVAILFLRVWFDHSGTGCNRMVRRNHSPDGYGQRSDHRAGE